MRPCGAARLPQSVQDGMQPKPEMTWHPRSVPAGHRKTRGTEKRTYIICVLWNAISSVCEFAVTQIHNTILPMVPAELNVAVLQLCLLVKHSKNETALLGS